jgi:hypothetical protein
MLKKPATKIDSLLEPLLLAASDAQADEFLLRLIDAHVATCPWRIINLGRKQHIIGLSISKMSSVAVADEFQNSTGMRRVGVIFFPIQTFTS